MKTEKLAVMPVSFNGFMNIKTLLYAGLDLIFAPISAFIAVLTIYMPEGRSLIECIFAVPVHPLAAVAIINPILYSISGAYGFRHRVARFDDALRAVAVAVMSTLIFSVSSVFAGAGLAAGVYIIYFAMMSGLSLSTRFYRRMTALIKKPVIPQYGRRSSDRIMLIGAGDAGEKILRLIQAETPVTHRGVVCIIDDDVRKHGTTLLGVPIIGGRKVIESAAREHNIGEIIIAAPSMKPSERGEIVMHCVRTRAKLLVLPNIYNMVDCEVKLGELSEVRIEDLLGQDPIRLEKDRVHEFIRGKRVMVTGGGGSIGSELCRQIAAGGPELLIVLDIYENTTYELELELRRDYPALNLEIVISSICDSDGITRVFEKYKPHTVFNAAAHKHVPLMESNVIEAVNNNVFGTLNLIRTADAAGVERFVMISSDKAVRPTNVMGVTKRVCEMMMQVYSRISKTRFSAVRFGNVLGTNGSVIPLFREQIARGGPVQVTHPEITRYFMTISEAVSLVLEAAALALGGEIFVLDMGKPIKITDLARSMIMLAGYEPDKEIKIEYIGLRPGEKLYEELIIDHENMVRTENNLIFIEKHAGLDESRLFELIGRLQTAVHINDDEVKKVLCEYIPEYTCSNTHAEILPLKQMMII